MLLHTAETVSGRVISGRAVSHVTEGLGRELDATAAERDLVIHSLRLRLVTASSSIVQLLMARCLVARNFGGSID